MVNLVALHALRTPEEKAIYVLEFKKEFVKSAEEGI